MEIGIAIVGLILTGLGIYFGLLPFMDQTRKDFRALQPNVQIGGASIISAGESYSVRLRLHNRGKSTAYDAIVSLDGWSGRQNIPVIHPLGPPGFNEYEVPIELGRESAIRTTKMESLRLRMSYRDRWGYQYEMSYPVVQSSRADGLQNIQIRDEQPTFNAPRVSFLKMRKYLKEIPSTSA
jgi:hypothetical protein